MCARILLSGISVAFPPRPLASILHPSREVDGNGPNIVKLCFLIQKPPLGSPAHGTRGAFIMESSDPGLSNRTQESTRRSQAHCSTHLHDVRHDSSATPLPLYLYVNMVCPPGRLVSKVKQARLQWGCGLPRACAAPSFATAPPFCRTPHSRARREGAAGPQPPTAAQRRNRTHSTLQTPEIPGNSATPGRR